MKQILFFIMLISGLFSMANRTVEWNGERLKINYELDNLQIHEIQDLESVELSLSE